MQIILSVRIYIHGSLFQQTIAILIMCVPFLNYSNIHQHRRAIRQHRQAIRRHRLCTVLPLQHIRQHRRTILPLAQIILPLHRTYFSNKSHALLAFINMYA